MENSIFVLPIRPISAINSKICLILGFVLNLLLILLVLKKTPKEMRPYSKIVLQTCICDLTLLCLSEIVQPILFVSGGVAMVLENGFSVQFAFPFNIIVYDIWLYSSHFVTVGICVQFIYRYLILCRVSKLGAKCYFCILFIAILVEAILMGFFAWIGYPPNGEMFLADQQVLRILGETKHFDQSENLDLRILLHGDKADYRWILWNLCFVTMNIICYAIIILCGTKMIAYVRKNLKMGNMKERAAAVNKQMTLNMIIQASTPLVDLLVFMMASYASMVGSQSDWLICATMLLGPFVNWVPVVNPLVTILTIAPYRKTVFRVGQSLPAGSNTTSHPPTQHPQPQPPTPATTHTQIPLQQPKVPIRSIVSPVRTNMARRATRY